eukprot:CAMPEP_0116089654 /NCGR_PEP_ID=MMETSP0327-20121206/6537_1 /TAXON_ID=44447 /ORGANISM="Pseudo-nitzschia delicatissima, Strain B596" /LENGTH=312 /DNA_ID=CAMNT_0003580853 /DNA_START=108 /DNA_END=1046 /DNA_ORIENTATION=-
MAAEFDSSGFSAVDKFFGGGGTEREESKKVTTAAGNRGKRRGGVGASTKSSDTKTLSSDLLAKQVLTVGRKRSRDDHNEDEYDGVDDHGVHDADEADGGRTSIAPKKTSSKTLGDKPQTSKPSKKLGRKERERQKQAAIAGGDANKEDPPPSSNTKTTETAEGADVVNHNNDPSHPKPKKKRRKVRSRQKNIRKDNRSADEKPAHLIPGNRNYKGRPMTQATREKLNLPPPVRKPFRSKWNNDEKADDSLFVIDRDPDSAGDDPGVKLAIDELMASDDKGDAEKSSSIDDEKPKKKEKKKSSKKKKNKFKNL